MGATLFLFDEGLSHCTPEELRYSPLIPTLPENGLKTALKRLFLKPAEKVTISFKRTT